jgi:hypothetical protein
MIQFPNGYTVKCVGGYGKSSIYDLLIHYYECIEIEESDEKIPDVIITLTEKGYKNLKKEIDELKNPFSRFLLGPQTKEELESLKLCGVPLYTVAMNEVYTMYKHLRFPIYDYINLGLVLGAYKMSSKNEELKASGPDECPKDSEVKLLNLKDSYISIEIEKNFSLRYTMMNENVRFIYESGVSEIGVLLCMEWVKKLTESHSKSHSVYTIFDIDEEDLKGKDLTDFLIPFTILGNLQKGFLIVNSDIAEDSSVSSVSSESLGHLPGPEAFDLGRSPESFDSEKSFGHLPGPEAFDFSLYNTLKGIWNSKEYIPRRKKLAEPLPDYQMFRDTIDERKSIHFEECIRKPPIFIIDRLISIKEWIKEHVAYFPDDKQIFVYVKKNFNFCKEENKNVNILKI